LSFHPRDVTASLIFRLLSSHLRARRFVCEAISSSAALRLLPATLLAPFPVPARSSFRFRSSLASQESLQASFFALFLCHCEVVVPLPKQSLQVASLRSQRRRKRPSDCFGASALVMTGEGVTARSPFRPPLLSLRGRLFVSEAVSLSSASLKNTRPLRRFAPRGDKRDITARSPFRFRSSLDRQESLRASLFSFGEAISSLTLWEYETASLCLQRQQKGEAISLFLCLGKPRDCFAPLAVTKGRTASSLSLLAVTPGGSLRASLVR